MVAVSVEQGATRSEAEYRRQSVTDQMTVNHVLKVVPQARDVFSRFGVETTRDGCHCLDELAWRRGVDVNALLDALADLGTDAPLS